MGTDPHKVKTDPPSKEMDPQGKSPGLEQAPLVLTGDISLGQLLTSRVSTQGSSACSSESATVVPTHFVPPSPGQHQLAHGH